MTVSLLTRDQVLEDLNMLVVALILALDQILIKDMEVIVIMMILVKLVNGESKKLKNLLNLQNLKYFLLKKFYSSHFSGRLYCESWN